MTNLYINKEKEKVLRDHVSKTKKEHPRRSLSSFMVEASLEKVKRESSEKTT